MTICGRLFLWRRWITSPSDPLSIWGCWACRLKVLIVCRLTSQAALEGREPCVGGQNWVVHILYTGKGLALSSHISWCHAFLGFLQFLVQSLCLPLWLMVITRAQAQCSSDYAAKCLLELCWELGAMVSDNVKEKERHEDGRCGESIIQPFSWLMEASARERNRWQATRELCLYSNTWGPTDTGKFRGNFARTWFLIKRPLHLHFNI